MFGSKKRKAEKTEAMRRWAIEQIPKQKIDKYGRDIVMTVEERTKEAEKLIFFIETGHSHNFGH